MYYHREGVKLMKRAPIVLFTYNRLWHTQQTVEALQKNLLASESELFIFSDGGKNEGDWKKVYAVREYLHTIDGFKKINITEQKENKGLASSVIEGVTKIVNKYGRIIVLEDDLVTSRYFLQYMNDALDIYENCKEVACISGYIYPIDALPETFFIKGADCWGWATWKRGWDIFNANGTDLLRQINSKNLETEFDFGNSYPYTQMLKDQISGKNNSWAIRWYASAFLKNKLCLYPQKAFVQNIGCDDTGTHCGNSLKFDVTIAANYTTIKKIPAEENLPVKRRISEFFKPQRKSKSTGFSFHNSKIEDIFMAFFNFLKKVNRKTKNEQKYGFFGDYSSWQEVEKLCKGYSDKSILQKTLESTLKVKNGEAVFERDSFIFDKIQYSCGLLASLLKVAVENDNKLKVLDFGGALGSHYFQNKKFLQPIKIEKWTVIEQKHYVDMGKERIADGVLNFAYSIEDVHDADVLILSCVLQYLPDPYEWLEKFISRKVPYIIFDRTAFSTEGCDRLTLQKVPPEIYDAQYPAWFLDKSKVFSMIQKKYELIAEFQDTIDLVKEIPSEYKGALFKLKNEYAVYL